MQNKYTVNQERRGSWY